MTFLNGLKEYAPKPVMPVNKNGGLFFKSTAGFIFWMCRVQGLTEQGRPRDVTRTDTRIIKSFIQLMGRLHDRGDLLTDHLLILRKYGALQRPPNPCLPPEEMAWTIWSDALQVLYPYLEKAGYIRPREHRPCLRAMRTRGHA